MGRQEETFNNSHSSNLLFLPLQESNNLKEALEQSPGLRQLVKEYYCLTQEEYLSPDKAKRMSEIFNLAMYDRSLDECIDNIQESIELIESIEQLESKKISIEEFITQIETTPARKMTIEKFQQISQSLELNPNFLSHYINFNNDSYHRKVIFSTHSICVFIICWQPGQKTTNHKHSNSFGLINVYQGTLTHRLSREDNTCGRGFKLLEEKLFTENEWICVDSSQSHQLINQSMENLITLHFRYFKKSDNRSSEYEDITTNNSTYSHSQMHSQHPIAI
jgi:predicted metal-dependent enzyme (double-stranded beta helix superfamily)